MHILTEPWPWWLVGPLIGLFVPLMLLLGGALGISSNFKHLCTLVFPSKKIPYLNYSLSPFLWNLWFLGGLFLGGLLGQFLSPAGTKLFSSFYFTPLGLVTLLLGGVLVGFGARWAEGCTSGHAITGLSALQKASLIAVLGFFTGGLALTGLHFLFQKLL